MDSNNFNKPEQPGTGQQNPYQQNPYQQPNAYQENPYQQPYAYENGEMEEPVSFGEWMITMLIMCIPCVNIVMMFVWAFGSSAKKSKSNYFKASLVWALISIVLSVIMLVVFGASMAAFGDLLY